MHSACTIAAMVLVSVGFGAHASAQDLSTYRSFALESSLESVITLTAARADAVRTLHERPARIQELQFRAPYRSDDEAVDPVQAILFSFLDGQLYQLVVTYDRDRTEGLTDTDMVGLLSAVYGPATRTVAQTRVMGPGGTFAAMTGVARWETDASRVTLVRDRYARDFQLMLTSRSLEPRAAAATREAARLDTLEAPRRESEQRRKAAADAESARETARKTNQTTFRP